MSGMWTTDAPITPEQGRAHKEALAVISTEVSHIGQLSGHHVVVKDIVVWVDGVEWRWEPFVERAMGDLSR